MICESILLTLEFLLLLQTRSSMYQVLRANQCALYYRDHCGTIKKETQSIWKNISHLFGGNSFCMHQPAHLDDTGLAMAWKQAGCNIQLQGRLHGSIFSIYYASTFVITELLFSIRIISSCRIVFVSNRNRPGRWILQCLIGKLNSIG